jgi:uncharacterized protein YjbI with pentapeptide repeats
MSKEGIVQQVIEQYKKGQRYFEGLDIDNGSFDGENLEGITFEDCTLYVSFKGANLKNAKFINGGIKTCDFREADLTNAHFENVCVEGSQFARAKTGGTFFDNNSAYGQHVSQAEFEEWIRFHEE